MSRLKICTGPRCSDHGSKYLADRAKAEQPGLTLETCGCLGLCEKGANVVLDGKTHHQVTSPKLAKILKK